MTGLNHALTGITIAIVFRRPEIALPLSFLSHFVLDTLPHSLMDVHNKKTFRGYLVIEALTMSLMTLIAMFLYPEQWLLIGLCAVTAFLPDMLWPFYHNGWLGDRRFFKQFYAFHQAIQRAESKRGFLLEALYGIALLIFILTASTPPII